MGWGPGNLASLCEGFIYKNLIQFIFVVNIPQMFNKRSFKT